ncbi:MAG: ATP synthase F1 subunit epsilon, F-type H+-transporting ATPase subunit epsilon [Microgenomates group bacterium GW2011_GWC1_41_8]|uniref:ATP synthase epsilon chain n=2 Tax=Candidatus Roizmaniibacteriota TaxID=1752723 RepID=A0A0G0T3V6_9BACT|nr:MAG: ATP synthase epsilon chain [Candidatus Levybacteria bacterium GW2011_GWA2_40_16]KKR71664.1 MAG: ATP synthase epsilon chain [Candidatus Roizmanbacteria bacterium GW2011_GWB1_40_7]KKR93990.1 MAG: ATP synthase epsilon chain [Candidatus Roizmanbacteria bacterium GW2011_GWA1_41_13]KKS23295.1 MAG: ATP synthase F1 subunit epsilon, F-type H+-transporting ATPase subunit epsilon [Microgenomates group bacterium GW2011_GWC1_41_8]OGK48459.1 MAG: ATP synthase F1 subunit epsilon [Candidatus Roizmanbac
MKTFSLDIVTPERLALTQEVELVSVPSTDGEITILPHHVPIFASLTEGEVRLHYENEDYYLSIGGGFIEVTPTKTTVLVTRAYKAEELNEKAILNAKQEAEEAIKKGVTPEDIQAAYALLRSSLVDLKVLRRRKFRTSV